MWLSVVSGVDYTGWVKVMVANGFIPRDVLLP
jgi:hypothetical protein